MGGLFAPLRGKEVLALEMRQEIFEKAKQVYREELPSGGEAALFEMSAAACRELLGRLREEVSLEAIQEEFIRAAAVLAVSLFLGLDCSEVDSFSAGSLRLKRRSINGSRRAASSLRNQAELMLIGYLKDTGFCFKAVR